MNRPAAKEPSMDEILSSIRQIIADDDASSSPSAGESASGPSEEDLSALLGDIETDAEGQPLALSTEQIIEAPEESDTLDFNSIVQDVKEEEPVTKAAFIDPEDISFESEPMADVLPFEPAPVPVSPPAPERPRPTAAQAAPMPDPMLSHDIAEELLEPTTNAAVRSNLTKLANLGLATPGLTIEALVRDMLRPMLKEWLDENLPGVVERMVEKEIARISRGIEGP